MQRRQGPDRRQVSRGGRRPSDVGGRFPSILVADSSDGARRPCVRYLDRFNFDVIEAVDGEEARARIRANPPHVILTEWMLPKLSAPRLAQWLAEDGTTRDIPMILLADEDEPEIGMPPAATVLIKPFQLSAMLEAVRRALRASGTASRSLA